PGIATSVVGYLAGRRRAIERRVARVDDRVGVVRSGQAVPPGRYRFDPLRLRSHRDAGSPMKIGFLLYATRVGDDQRRVTLEPGHVEYPHWIDEPRAAKLEAVCLERLLGSGVDREDQGAIARQLR